MNAIVTILVAESAGVLSALVLNLSPKGYRLESHKMMVPESGRDRMRLVLKCPSPNRAQLENDLLSLGHGISIENIELDSTVEAVDGGVRTEKEVLRDISRAFPDVAEIVRHYAQTLSGDKRAKSLLELGNKTGRAIYKRDFSLGSPLKMPAAWRRVIVPAVKHFGDTKASDDSFTLLDGPFSSRDSQPNCCEFVTGFVQGLLDAGPYTKETRVREATCTAKGAPGCTFVVEK